MPSMFDRLPEEIVSYIFEMSRHLEYRTNVVEHITSVSQARLRRLYLPWILNTHPLVFENSSLPPSTIRRIMSGAILECFNVVGANIEAEDDDNFEHSQLRRQAVSLIETCLHSKSLS